MVPASGPLVEGQSTRASLPRACKMISNAKPEDMPSEKPSAANFLRVSLLSRNEFESGTFTIVLHATSSFTYVSVIYGANFPFKPCRETMKPMQRKKRNLIKMPPWTDFLSDHT